MSPGVIRTGMLLYVTCVMTVCCIAVLHRGWPRLSNTERLARALSLAVCPAVARTGAASRCSAAPSTAVAEARASAVGCPWHKQSPTRENARPPGRTRTSAVKSGRCVGMAEPIRRHRMCGSMRAREAWAVPEKQSSTGPVSPVGRCHTARVGYRSQAERAPTPLPRAAWGVDAGAGQCTG